MWPNLIQPNGSQASSRLLFGGGGLCRSKTSDMKLGDLRPDRPRSEAEDYFWVEQLNTAFKTYVNVT